jgi:hypothetical protein
MTTLFFTSERSPGTPELRRIQQRYRCHPHVNPVQEYALKPEPFLTIKEAAALLNIPYFKLQRAAKLGLFPVYRLFNKRCYVRISEVEQAMKSTTVSEVQS